MYVPKQFEEQRVDVLHDLIRARPLATLVTLSSSGLNANHIPLHLSESPTPFGTLRVPYHIETMMAAIVGIEMVISKSVGKWKAS